MGQNIARLLALILKVLREERLPRRAVSFLSGFSCFWERYGLFKVFAGCGLGEVKIYNMIFYIFLWIAQLFVFKDRLAM